MKPSKRPAQPAQSPPQSAAQPAQSRSEVCAEVLDIVASGKSLRKACREAKASVTKSSFLRWMAESPELADQYARAKGEGLRCQAEEIVDLSDEEPLRGPDGKVDTGWVQWNKNRVEARKWNLSKELPKVYGDRVNLDHSGSVTLESLILQSQKDSEAAS